MFYHDLLKNMRKPQKRNENLRSYYSYVTFNLFRKTSRTCLLKSLPDEKHFLMSKKLSSFSEQDFPVSLRLIENCFISCDGQKFTSFTDLIRKTPRKSSFSTVCQVRNLRIEIEHGAVSLIPYYNTY